MAVYFEKWETVLSTTHLLCDTVCLQFVSELLCNVKVADLVVQQLGKNVAKLLEHIVYQFSSRVGKKLKYKSSLTDSIKGFSHIKAFLMCIFSNKYTQMSKYFLDWK